MKPYFIPDPGFFAGKQDGKLVSDEIRMSDGSTIPNTPEALEAYQAARKDGIEQARAMCERKNAESTGRRCPFYFDSQQVHKTCVTSCGLYRDGCSRSQHAATRETAGGFCPFLGKCSKDCAVYDGGCTL